MRCSLPLDRRLKMISILGLAVVLLAILLPTPVHADIGPKPTASFQFVWEDGDTLSITDGVLLQCKDAACIDNHPLENMGPQHFACSQTACDSMAYGYDRYMKLVITFSDGSTRESNVFEKQFDASRYDVTVQANALTVVEQRGSNYFLYDPIGSLLTIVKIVAGLFAMVIFLGIGIFMISKTREAPLNYERAKIPVIAVWVIALPAVILGLVLAPSLPLTIFIELVVISLYTWIMKHRWFPWATVVTLGNLFTQMLFLVALDLTGSWGMPFALTLFLEIIIWILEAALIHMTLRRKQSLIASLGISFLLNAISMGIGLLLPL
ncbi:MAG: hypothetical protein P1S60_14065 [Anaerolineae bacterium]|nr:hypothetical protein [Anaerolineae bacterium]